MTAPSSDLAGRVRAALRPREVAEKRMFGVHCFLLAGALVLGARRDGSLLVRVDPAADAELLSRPHACRSEMGRGRSMGVGWIRVDAAGLGTDAKLRFWVDAALARTAPVG